MWLNAEFVYLCFLPTGCTQRAAFFLKLFLGVDLMEHGLNR